jgi:3',5'-cyclic AMP phosphodiesterase CpdA
LYRIAHISDLHLRAENGNKHLDLFLALLNDIKIKKCDHLVITGDISDTSDPGDFIIITDILKKNNFYNPEKLSVTIGNHDIFGGAKKGQDVFLFPTESKNVDYFLKVHQFNKYFQATSNDNNYMCKIEDSLSLKFLTGNIVLISINSIAQWSANKNPISSNGFISSKNIKRIKKLLDNEDLEKKIKIVLIHHHFKEPRNNELNNPHSLWLYSERNTMKLHHKERILKLFDKYEINFILHGHTHITESYNINGRTFLNSSGCIMPFTDDRKLQYYILNIPEKAIRSDNITFRKITL